MPRVVTKTQSSDSFLSVRADSTVVERRNQKPVSEQTSDAYVVARW